ncbi:MAG: 16S rRNA (guanine(966)-N(2))-methyltransferase RsmD [Pseudomonadota bacterium]
MRIVAGKHRSVALASLGKGDPGAHLRPTSDRVRESLFNVLAGYDVIDGARVLDLFAGTGALGLEALSRGAVYVAFVDDGRAAQRLIGQNIAKLRASDQTEIIRRDARRLPGRTGAPFDLVFLDPPYRKGFGTTALLTADRGGWLARGAFVVWEEASAMEVPAGFDLVDCRKYGDTYVNLMSKQSKTPI